MPSKQQKNKIKHILADALANYQENQPATIGSRRFEREFYAEVVESNGKLLMEHAMVCSRVDGEERICKKATILGKQYHALGGNAISGQSLFDLNAELMRLGLPYRIDNSPKEPVVVPKL